MKGKKLTRKGWKRFVRVLSCLVVFCTTYALILPAITAQAQAYCGQEEHNHSEDCYTRQLECEVNEDEDPEHVHSDSCYRNILNCGKTPHQHTRICFSNPDADIETAEDWEKTLPKEDELKDKTVREKIVAVAESQLGTAESDKNYEVDSETEVRGITRYGQWDEAPYEEWSGAFARFVLHYAGLDEGKEDADTYVKAEKDIDKWTDSLQEKGELLPINEGKPGDVLYIYDEDDDNRLKAGIITEVKDDTIKAIIGNRNNKVDNQQIKFDNKNVRAVYKPVPDDRPDSENSDPSENDNNSKKIEDEKINVDDDDQSLSQDSTDPAKNEIDQVLGDEIPTEDQVTETDETNDVAGEDESNQETKTVELTDGVSVTATWQRDAFDYPDVTFQAKSVDLTAEEKDEVESKIEGVESAQLTSYDLSFFRRNENSELEEIEPKSEINIMFNLPSDRAQPDSVLHILESGVVEEVDLGRAKEETTTETEVEINDDLSNSISFSSSKFSTYVLVNLNNTSAIDVYNYSDINKYCWSGSGNSLNSNQYLKLQSDIKMGKDDLTISVAKNVTIDLNGKYIFRDQENKNGMFNVQNGATLKITNNQNAVEYDHSATTDGVGYSVENGHKIYFNYSANQQKEVQNAGALVMWNDINSGQSVINVNSGGTLIIEDTGILGAFAGNAISTAGTVKMAQTYLVNNGRGINATGGTIDIKDGYIANNRMTVADAEASDAYESAGAGIKASNETVINLGKEAISNIGDENEKEKGKVHISYNRLIDAGARTYGAGIQLRGSKLNIYNAIIENNSVSGKAWTNTQTGDTGTQWVGGGGIAVLCQITSVENQRDVWKPVKTNGKWDESKVKENGIEVTNGKPSEVRMYTGSVVRNNTSSSGGGGFFIQGYRDDSDPHQAPNLNYEWSSKLFMYDGEISGNIAKSNEGGGIHQAAKYSSYAYLYKGEIFGNKTETTVHWGGGGIFTGEKSYIFFPNGASFYDNTSQGLGGGITACSTGNIIFDESVVSVNNTSNADSWTKEGTEKPFDTEYARDKGYFINAGEAKDFFSCLYASISGVFKGNNPANWTGSVDYNPVKDIGDGTLTANQLMGLSSKSGLTNAQASDLNELKIYKNKSGVHGAGILVNGYMIGGDVEFLPSGPTVTIQGKKSLLRQDGSTLNMTERQFEFELVEPNGSSEEVIATGYNDSNGQIKFEPPVVFQPDLTHVTNTNQTLNTEVEYLLREKSPDGIPSFVYDSNVYHLKFTLTTKFEFVMTYHIYDEDGKVTKTISVYKADTSAVLKSVTNLNGESIPYEWKNGENVGSMNNKILSINPNGNLFINKEIPKKELTVRKVWQDSSGQVISAPEGASITVQLFRRKNGEAYPADPYQTATLSSENDWQYTFKDLDATYEYEVREVGDFPLFETIIGNAATESSEKEIWVRTNQLQSGEQYLVASKNAKGQLVVLKNTNEKKGENVYRFTSSDHTVLNNVFEETFTTQTDSGNKTYIGFDLPSSFELDKHSYQGYQATNSVLLATTNTGDWSKRAIRPEDWAGNDSISRLMLAELSTMSDDILTLPNYSISQRGFSYRFDTGEKRDHFSSTYNLNLNDSNSNPVYVYKKEKVVIKDDANQTVTIANRKKSNYSLIVQKIDGSTKSPIEGVTFCLYTQESGGDPIKVRKNSNSINEYRVDDKSSLSSMTTDSNGQIKINDLAHGTYYLEEVDSLEGYMPLDSRVKVEISEAADKSDKTEDLQINLTVENFLTYELPETGGPGTNIITASGVALIVLSSCMYKASRKRNRKEGE